MGAKRSDIRGLAKRLRQFIDDNPDVHLLSVPLLHQQLGPIAKKHEWELALARLNKTGDVGARIKPAHPHGDGWERADRYLVTRRRRRGRS